MNRLKTVEVHKRNGVELGTPEVTTYDYTKVGSRASVSMPNGITTSYQYDSLNRLTNLTHKKADTLIASYTYNLLPAGRRSAVTEVTPEGTSQINYTYDNLYRLTNETRTGVNPFTASYAYDINSNRTQKVETVNGITETINYEYNANDQLLSEVSSANGTTVYTYDVNGSLTNKASEGKFSYQYGYDLRNRLATANITRKEGTADVTITSSYAYNADGIRTRALQTINGNTQNRYFLLDDGHTGYAQVFEETAELGGSIVRSYTIGDDVLSQTVTGVTSHLLYDGHGSTRQLADNNGAVTANYAYDAYGKMLGGNPGVTDGKTSATDLLYAGEQFDPGLQMEYLRARYYDQDNGQFNRLDPFEGNSEDPQSLHKYAYCHADPVNGIDPSGEFTLIGILLTMSITIIAISLSAPIWTRLHVFYATYNSTPMTEQDLRRAKAAMDFWWPHETKMQNLSKKIKQILDSGVDNSCPIRVFSTPFASGSRIITNNMYVEEDILQENSAGLALVIFGEYQHTAEGGGLGERAAQDELIPLKRRLIGTPVWTPFIMALHHGGTDPW